MAQPSTFSIHCRELGPMENFVYLIHDHASDRAAIVDPAWDVASVTALAREQGMKITDILLTHSHHDHINGIEKVLQEFDAEIHLTRAEHRFWDGGVARATTGPLHDSAGVLTFVFACLLLIGFGALLRRVPEAPADPSRAA